MSCAPADANDALVVLARFFSWKLAAAAVVALEIPSAERKSGVAVVARRSAPATPEERVIRAARDRARCARLSRRQAAPMVGDGAANAEVSGSGRTSGERDRADAETVSGTVGTAERSISADVPPGLWQFARKKLREAYFHAARASVRDLELNPRPPRDEDRLAADPPDPEPGVLRALSAIRDLAREPGLAYDASPSADDDDETREEPLPGKKNADGVEAMKTKETNAKRRRKATRASTVCARFDASTKAAARLARADWRAATALLLEEDASFRAAEDGTAEDETSSRSRRAVLAHLERAAESERRAKWRTETITGRHSDLRRRAGQPEADSRKSFFGAPDEEKSDVFVKDKSDVAERAWRCATGVSADSKDAAHALAYAEAAEETGRKPWVTEALRWCHDFAVYFLQGGGAAELAVKAERRRFFEAFGKRMTDAEITATRDKFLNGHLGMDGDPGLVPFARRGAARVLSGEEKEKELSNKPRAHLLDVGSCWDYFRAFTEGDSNSAYEVVSLDLEPRTPNVFKCDFLELKIGDEGSKMTTEKTSTTTFLSSYPANRASVVVMSLVLSYLPDPFMRGEMVRRARRVLLNDGRGVLLIVTPHSTDRSYSNANRTNALAIWKENIESLGFERAAYERMRSVHCVAFRTVGNGPGVDVGRRAPELPIAFDAKEREKPPA